MRLLITLLIILLLIPQVIAQTGHLTLLTVTETDSPLDERHGGTADLFLEMKPGNGQIFIDTYPLTRVDTQSSTRFANQVACAYVETDCSRYDFFYTIRAGSPVIGGPSAGAAIAVLTVAMLDGLELDSNMAMTGTINSGGLIGPVAGEKEKSMAAAEAGLTTVLISSFSVPQTLNRTYVEQLNRSMNERGNESINLSRFYIPVELDGLGVNIVRVSSLEEALAQFTGQASVEEVQPLIVPESYTEIMQSVTEKLCSRRTVLIEELVAEDKYEEDANLTVRYINAMEREDWYSAASYCFGDLIRLRSISFEDMISLKRMGLYAQLLKQTHELRDKLDENLNQLDTLAELETYVIVSTRLEEVQKALLKEDRYNISASTLGFAYERFNSAKVWSAFFEMESPTINLNEAHLIRACNERLALAEERLNYAKLYLPDRLLIDAREELDEAWSEQSNDLYALCLFRASRALAEANLLAGSLAVREEHLDALIDAKLVAAEAMIAEQATAGSFPILGYSYFRYAASLAESDPFSAMTFSEYALELSNLALYFPEPQGFRVPVQAYLVLLFLSGFVLGAGLSAFVTVKMVRKG
ncbi:hypothetical protein GOV07_03270, partial [Candidatus Woesearchaeota archaeon]|nr:hypothetical protein [Candidatus Woesearchaeota archaeon]